MCALVRISRLARIFAAGSVAFCQFMFPASGQTTPWKQVAAAGPSARISASIAYDSSRGRTVLFGGYDGAAAVPLSDTWEWDGIGWTQVATGWPLARVYASVAYDSARGRTVLFGGYGYVGLGNYGNLADTCQWDGSAWTQVAVTGPPARHAASMAYDNIRGKAVLFGGLDSRSNRLSDTWEWDGTIWKLATTTGPPARYGASMAYDSARGRAVLFGGHDISDNPLSDTWEWDGKAWTQVATGGPVARGEAPMAFDSARGRTVLFGGGNNQISDNPLSDTWEWDGKSWTQVVTGGPAARSEASMAYDSARSRAVLFGGGGAGYFSDTWEYGTAYLAFRTQPGAGASGATLGTQPIVEVRRGDGTVETAFSGRVTLSIKPGTGALGAAIRGTTTVPLVSGVANFTNLSLDKPGTGYVLSTTTGTLPLVESLPFNVYAPPAHLVFSTQPNLAEAGKPFQQQPVMLARDASNLLIEDYNGPVTLAIKAGTGTPGAALTGISTVIAVNGVATFTDLGVDKRGTGYVLEAFVGANKLGESDPFNVAPAAQRLVFAVQPGGATDDWPFTTQPVVSVIDADGDTATLNRDVVTLALKPGTGASGATLNGTSSVTALHGIAGFAGLGIGAVGTAYVLTASSPGITAVDSAPFDVIEAPKLVLRQSAANEIEVSVRPAGATIIGATVALSWNSAELAPVKAADIHIAVGWSADYSDTSSGLTTTLTNPGTNANGVVLTLHSIAQPGFSGHSATVSLTDSSDLTDDSYSTLPVLPRTIAFVPGAHLVYTRQPALTEAGAPIAGPPTVAMLDGTNSVVSDFTNAISVGIKAGTGTTGAVLGGATNVMAAAGLAAFNGVTIDRKGTGYVLVGSTGPFFADSLAFDIAPKAQKLAFTTQPGNGRSGLPMVPQPVITVQDNDGATASAFNGPIALAIKPGTGFPGAVLAGAATINAVSGVAAFDDVRIGTAAPGYVLTASGLSLTGAESAAFTVTPFAFTTADGRNTLRWSAGISPVPPGYLTRFDVVLNGKVDLADAVRITRKAAGLEVNP